MRTYQQLQRILDMVVEMAQDFALGLLGIRRRLDAMDDVITLIYKLQVKEFKLIHEIHSALIPPLPVAFRVTLHTAPAPASVSSKEGE